MSTPQVVQRQLEAAEALQQGLLSQLGAQPPEQSVQVAAPAPVPAPTPTPAPAPTVDWEQRFRTVDGMYKAEVPSLRASNKALEAQVVSLSEQVQALVTATKNAPKPVEKPQPDPRDVEQFGADLVDMVQRRANEVFTRLTSEIGDMAQKLDDRVSAIERNLKGVTQETAASREELFYTALEESVPNWREVNESEGWKLWLAETDPVYRVARQEALNAAHQALNARHVIAIFQKYLESVPRRETLSNQVAPNTSNAQPVTPVTTAKRTITTREINQFYHDQARGRFRGREAEEAALEAEINAAVAEGRVAQV